MARLSAIVASGVMGAAPHRARSGRGSGEMISLAAQIFPLCSGYTQNLAKGRYIHEMVSCPRLPSDR